MTTCQYCSEPWLECSCPVCPYGNSRHFENEEGEIYCDSCSEAMIAKWGNHESDTGI